METSPSSRPTRIRDVFRFAVAGTGLILLAALSVFAGEPGGRSGDLADDLLAIWAPQPDWRSRLGWPAEDNWNICSLKTRWAPADNAPSELLVAYWAWASSWRAQVPLPSARVRERLLDECERNPDLLPDLHYLVNGTFAHKERVLRIMERARSELSPAGWKRFECRLEHRQSPRFWREPGGPPPHPSARQDHSGESRPPGSLDETAEMDQALDEFLANKDPKKVGWLRNLLAADSLSAAARRKATEALLDWEDIGRHEVTDCFEAVARKLATEEGRLFIERAQADLPYKKKALAPVLGKGIRLISCGPLDDEIASRVLDRADSIRAFAPDAAHGLETIVAPWPIQAVERRLLLGILREDAVASVVHVFLKKRERLLFSVPQEVHALDASWGSTRGIGAALLADPASVEAVIDGTDSDAQRTLLACLRLVRHPLPLVKVRKLLDASDDRLSRVAQAYLEGEGGLGAREMVWARRPEEVRIVGARMERPPGHISFTRLDAAEAILQREMRDDGGPDEIFALIGGGWDAVVHSRIVRIRGTEVRYALERKGEVVASRVLSAGEWKDLHDLVGSGALDDLPPLTSRIFDGVQWEYVHLTRRGGSRVFMHCPGAESGSRGTAYDSLMLAFHALDERR